MWTACGQGGKGRVLAHRAWRTSVMNSGRPRRARQCVNTYDNINNINTNYY